MKNLIYLYSVAVISFNLLNAAALGHLDREAAPLPHAVPDSAETTSNVIERPKLYCLWEKNGSGILAQNGIDPLITLIKDIETQLVQGGYTVGELVHSVGMSLGIIPYKDAYLSAFKVSIFAKLNSKGQLQLMNAEEQADYHWAFGNLSQRPIKKAGVLNNYAVKVSFTLKDKPSK